MHAPVLPHDRYAARGGISTYSDEGIEPPLVRYFGNGASVASRYAARSPAGRVVELEHARTYHVPVT